MSTGRAILVADDDPHIREVLGFAFEKAGYSVSFAADGKEALSAFRKQPPDLLVLDIMMPEYDGLEVCREIRKSSATPILFLSSRSEEIDRILGLELGGDDYVSKPFSPREVVARVKAILRRHAPKESAPAKRDETKRLIYGPLSLDPDNHSVFCNEQEVELTATQFNLLHTLMRRPGKVFSRDELMDKAYRNETIVTDRTIDSHIRGIRKKLEAVGSGEIVQTVHAVGYRLPLLDEPNK